MANTHRYTSKQRRKSIGRRLQLVLIKFLLLFVTATALPVSLFRWLPPPTSTFMLYRHYQDWVEKSEVKAIEYHWVPAQDISLNAYKAVIASEDQRFFKHAGFDFNAIQASIDHYKDGGKLRGASTISQQVAKNLFLTPAKNLIRKAMEAWFTLLIESFWSKQRILQTYLNIAEFGDHLFGIEAASRHYFGISAKHISPDQAALLAATLPNPMLLKAEKPSAYVHKRQRWISYQMRLLDVGGISTN